MVAEANFPKFDDALFLVYDLNPSAFQDVYNKAKADYDSTFQKKLIVTNNLVKHAVYDDGNDFRNHQPCIWHAFAAIQNPAMRLHHDTDDQSYLQKLLDYYKAITKHHRRTHGYIGAVDPYSFKDDPYNYYLVPASCGYISNKITSIVRASSTIKVFWTTVGDIDLTEPLIVTYADTGWFNKINFSFAEKEITLRSVVGKGTITFPYDIKKAKMDGQDYTEFEENVLYTTLGSHSYTIKLTPKAPTLPMISIAIGAMGITALVLIYVSYRHKKAHPNYRAPIFFNCSAYDILLTPSSVCLLYCSILNPK